MPLGSIYILTCTMGWSLPFVWPIVISAAGSLGYKTVTNLDENSRLKGDINKEINSLQSVKLAIDHQVTEVIDEQVKRDESLQFEKDEITIIFKRDLRGKFSVEVMGPKTKSRQELTALGHEFLGVVVQQFSYNRMAEQMERRGANIIGEEVTEDGDIVLKLRRWE